MESFCPLFPLQTLLTKLCGQDRLLRRLQEEIDQRQEEKVLGHRGHGLCPGPALSMTTGVGTLADGEDVAGAGDTPLGLGVVCKAHYLL